MNTTCKYCGQTTGADERGGCLACGAPKPDKEKQFNIQIANVKIGSIPDLPKPMKPSVRLK